MGGGALFFSEGTPGRVRARGVARRRTFRDAPGASERLFRWVLRLAEKWCLWLCDSSRVLFRCHRTRALERCVGTLDRCQIGDRKRRGGISSIREKQRAKGRQARLSHARALRKCVPSRRRSLPLSDERTPLVEAVLFRGSEYARDKASARLPDRLPAHFEKKHPISLSLSLSCTKKSRVSRACLSSRVQRDGAFQETSPTLRSFRSFCAALSAATRSTRVARRSAESGRQPGPISPPFFPFSFSFSFSFERERESSRAGCLEAAPAVQCRDVRFVLCSYRRVGTSRSCPLGLFEKTLDRPLFKHQSSTTLNTERPNPQSFPVVLCAVSREPQRSSRHKGGEGRTASSL